MTAAALVSRADLKRMAEIAKLTGVAFEVIINGKVIRAVPIASEASQKSDLDLEPDDFASFEDWQAWRERERVREAQRRS